MKFYSITGRKDEPIIALGPYTGGYGHFFCQYLQCLSTLRSRNPNATIICGGADVYYHYAALFADYYLGYKHAWAVAATAQSYSDDVKLDPTLAHFYKDVIANIGMPKSYLNTFNGEQACHNLYTSHMDNFKMIRDIPYNPQSDLIVVWGRMKKGADWRNGNAKMWRATIEHLQKQGFRVAVAGSRGTSMFFEDMANVIDLTNYDDAERGAVINKALQEARCALVDMSGTMCECYLVGCPLLTFNADPRHIRVIPSRNIFDTKEAFVVPKKWSNWMQNPLSDDDMSYMDMWLNAVDNFIEECGNTPEPWERTAASAKNVLWAGAAVKADKPVKVYGEKGDKP